MRSKPADGRLHHVMVVERDAELRHSIQKTLERDGFHVTTFSDAESMFALIPHHHPDLVVLSIDLSGMSGLEALKRLQPHGRIPAIVVSWRGSELDRIIGLELGADDYLVKPISTRELLARVHSVLRRAEEPVESETLEFDGLVIDLSARSVRVGEKAVGLTALEFDLLAFLASSPGKCYSREALLDSVWGSSSEWQSTATVSEHVYRIRHKLESDPSRPRWIQTVRGVGYRFVP